MPPQNAQVGGGQAGVYDTKTRVSHISWIPFDNSEAMHMYKKLEEVMWMTNKRHFGFENMEINEHAQYTEYPRVVFMIGTWIWTLIWQKNPLLEKYQ